MTKEVKTCQQSFVSMTGLVLPNDTNNHHTLFGGILLKKMDEIASISAMRHCRTKVVTASIDSVDFLKAVLPTESLCLEAFVTWSGRTSVEVFVKAITEELKSGKQQVAATAFLTFVSLDDNYKPTKAPTVVPENDEEIMLHQTGEMRAQQRKERKIESKRFAALWQK